MLLCGAKVKLSFLSVSWCMSLSLQGSSRSGMLVLFLSLSSSMDAVSK